MDLKKSNGYFPKDKTQMKISTWKYGRNQGHCKLIRVVKKLAIASHSEDEKGLVEVENGMAT